MAAAVQEEAVQIEEQAQDTSAQAEHSASSAEPVQSSDKPEQSAEDSAQQTTATEEEQSSTEEQTEADTTETQSAPSRTDKRKAAIKGEIQDLLGQRAKVRDQLERGLRATLTPAAKADTQPKVPEPSEAEKRLTTLTNQYWQAKQGGATDAALAPTVEEADRLRQQIVVEQSAKAAEERVFNRLNQEKSFESDIKTYVSTIDRLDSKFPFLKEDNGKTVFDTEAPLIKMANQIAIQRGISGQLNRMQELDLLKDAALEMAMGDSVLSQAESKQIANKAKATMARTGLTPGGTGSTPPTTGNNTLATLKKAAEATPDGSAQWDDYFDALIKRKMA